MLPHSHSRPLSALPGRKRDHPDADQTDVGVDAVLSADVGDAPMRQRQYTASVPESLRSADRKMSGLSAIRSRSVDQHVGLERIAAASAH